MTLRLRTDEEIEQFILHPKNQASLSRAVKRALSALNKKEKRRLDVKVNKLALRAVFGPHVFRSAEGRKLKAIAERRKPDLRGEKLRELGKTLEKAGSKLQMVVWAIPPEKLTGFNEEHKETVIHLFKTGPLQELYLTSEYLKTRGKW